MTMTMTMTTTRMRMVVVEGRATQDAAAPTVAVQVAACCPAFAMAGCSRVAAMVADQVFPACATQGVAGREARGPTAVGRPGRAAAAAGPDAKRAALVSSMRQTAVFGQTLRCVGVAAAATASIRA
jgi:hypothetical protein